MSIPKELPLVSLASWSIRDPIAKQAMAQAVITLCRRTRFIYLIDHDIKPSIVHQTFCESRRFFALPEQEKARVHYKHSGYHRGYVPLRSERTDPAATADLKEGLDCGIELFPEHPDCAAAPRMRAPNQWPVNLPSFKSAVECYMTAAIELAKTLFQILALGLGLPIDYFGDKTGAPIAQLRLAHYPMQRPGSGATEAGIGAHCDYECLTILAQDETGGLQVQNRAGSWIDVSPVPGTLIMIVGEMMERWTNGLLKATPHKAINISNQERYAIALFFGTNYDTVIRCLDTCKSSTRPALYEPVVAGDYLMKRLKSVSYVFM